MSVFALYIHMYYGVFFVPFQDRRDASFRYEKLACRSTVRPRRILVYDSFLLLGPNTRKWANVPHVLYRMAVY